MKLMQTEAHVKKVIKEKLQRYTGRISWIWPAATMYGKRGQPDLIINANGYFIAVEVKSPKKEAILDPHQELIKQEIIDANGQYCIVYDKESVFFLETLIRSLLKQTNNSDIALNFLQPTGESKK